jgi:hypothetical protein
VQRLLVPLDYSLLAIIDLHPPIAIALLIQASNLLAISDAPDVAEVIEY